MPQPPEPPKKPLPPLPPIGRWQPTSPRQRRRLVLAAIAMALALWSLLLLRPGAKVRQFPPDPPLPRCAPAQTTGCVGGTAHVHLLPAQPASGASAPR